MMGKLARVLLLAEAFAVATYGIGWWSVPIIAAAWALFSSDAKSARFAALCAAGGWATLFCSMSRKAQSLRWRRDSEA